MGPTAPGAAGAAASFRVTHPFHPLAGQELELLGRRSNYGRQHVYYHDAGGRLRSLPLGWTDLAAPDLFLEMGRGRSFFRPDDLLRLADLIAVLSGGKRRGRGSRRPPMCKRNFAASVNTIMPSMLGLIYRLLAVHWAYTREKGLAIPG
ncbi:MAG: DUF5372 family protein [Planctomycetota bacterium]